MAKIKAWIGVVAGCIFSIVLYYKTNDTVVLYSMPAFALIGFGYAFSLNVLRSWLASVASTSSNIAFTALILQLLVGRGLLPGLFICFFLFIFAVGFAYLPGIYIGMRDLYRESESSSHEAKATVDEVVSGRSSSQADGGAYACEGKGRVSAPAKTRRALWTVVTLGAICCLGAGIFIGKFGGKFSPKSNIPPHVQRDIPQASSKNTKNKIVPLNYESVIVTNYIGGNVVQKNGKYYSIHREAKSFDDARKFCKRFGGDLSVVDSQSINNILYAMMKINGFDGAYFGLTRRNTERLWKTVSGENPAYINWHPGEPNNENNNEMYAMFYRKFPDATWNDGDYGSFRPPLEKAFFCTAQTNFRYEKNEPDQPDLSKLIGIYEGTYTMNSKQRALVLEVSRHSDGRVRAIFNFSDIVDKEKYGKFEMDIRYDASSDTYDLDGAQWLRRPNNMVFVHLEGRLKGTEFSGSVVGGGGFSVRKTF